jgi:hypothetical protein
MDRADFVHLVRLSEHASADDSARYRRSVAAFAALGYVWVLGCLALAVGLIVWALWSIREERFSFTRGWVLLFAGGLLWATLRALWVRFDEPEGVELHREDAPALFEALDRIRARIKGPQVHRVYLDDEFNASIRQVPRFGLFGGAINSLSIGLPLLMMLDRRRLLSVLAHEYGHLRGNHGKLSAWIYRTRLSWLKLDANLQRNESVMALFSGAFFRWYFPRFAAKTFALARQDEYEADRISGRLLGTSVAAAALTEIAIKGNWYANEFWPWHWSRAEHEPQPPGPFAALRKRVRTPPDDDFARQALREAMRRVSDLDDTHPVLRDRLEALEQKAVLPEWSKRSALELLEDRKKWIEYFDNRWRRAHAADWKQHHAHRSRIRERISVLAARGEHNTPDEMVEWADSERRLDPAAPVRPRYESALRIAPEHPGALRGLAQMLSRERPERAACRARAAAWRWSGQPLVGGPERRGLAGRPRRGRARRRGAEAVARPPQGGGRSRDACLGRNHRHAVLQPDLAARPERLRAGRTPGRPRALPARLQGLAGAQEPARVSVAPRLHRLHRPAAARRRGPLADVPPAGADADPARGGAGAVGGPFAHGGRHRAAGFRRTLGARRIASLARRAAKGGRLAETIGGCTPKPCWRPPPIWSALS